MTGINDASMKAEEAPSKMNDSQKLEIDDPLIPPWNETEEEEEARRQQEDEVDECSYHNPPAA